MRRLIYDVLVLGWKNLVLGTILLFTLLFMFASLGVQLFAGGGKDNVAMFCNDPNIRTEEECVGHFFMNIEISPQEFLATGENDFSIYVPRVW